MDSDEIGVLSILLFFLGLFVFGGYLLYKDNKNWEETPIVQAECALERSNFTPSTLQTHAAPTVTSNGDIGMTFYQTGHTEKNSTVWNCGPLGRLSSDNKEVFRWAKEKSILLTKTRGEETRIIGVKR